MSEMFVVVLHYGDRSGIQGMWGPYYCKPDAEAGMAALKAWPMDGLWSIESLLPGIGGGSRG